MSEFRRHVGVIFAGSMFSQVLGIAAVPWLSRLYSPEQYGIFGIFVGLVAVTGVISTLRYTYAIQISADSAEAELLMGASKAMVAGFSALLFGLLWFSHRQFLTLLSLESIGDYILLLPAATFLAGLMEIYSVWLNRNKRFKSLTYNRILISVTTTLFSVTWAYNIDQSFKGLLIGMLAAQSIGTIFLHLESQRIIRPRQPTKLRAILSLLKSHGDFALFSLPSDLINVLTNQLPIFLLGRYAGINEVGYFNMSNRLLGLPAVFISSSVGEVFRQRATDDYHARGTCRPIFLKVFKALVLTGAFPFMCIIAFGPHIFPKLLGARWTEAGQYSQILALLFFLRFAVSPLTYTFIIANKQRMDFIGHILMLLGTTLPFYVGFVIFKSVILSLMLYSITYSAIYVLYYFMSYAYTEKPGFSNSPRPRPA